MSTRRGHGEGSVFQRKSDGLWVGVINLGRVGGKRRRRWIYGETRKEVAEKIKAPLHDQQRGVRIVSDRQTLGAYLEQWLAGAESSVGGSTFKRYAELVRVHLIPRLGAIPLQRLTSSDLGAAYAAIAKVRAPRTAGHAHRVLGRALREAEAAGLVQSNVARLVRPPRVPRAEMKTLSAEQARALLQAAEGDRLEALYHVALASGARQGELLALRWSDIDLDSGKIRIQRSLSRTTSGLEMGETKTESSRRTVPIGAAAKTLKAHRARQAEERFQARERWNDNGLVFADEVGQPLDGVKVTRSSFYRALDRANLPRVRFHDLRHTAATLMFENGVHPRVVAERLGHSTPNLVMNIYGHVTERMQDKATAAMDAALYS